MVSDFHIDPQNWPWYIFSLILKKQNNCHFHHMQHRKILYYYYYKVCVNEKYEWCLCKQSAWSVNHILSICVRVQSNESFPQVSVCVYRSPVISAVMADRSASSVKMFLMPSCCRVSLRSIFCSTLNLNISERSVYSIQVLHESNLNENTVSHRGR